MQNKKRLHFSLLLALCFFVLFLVVQPVRAKNDNVLLLHSYNPDFAWTKDITQGIEFAFANSSAVLQNEYIKAKRYSSALQIEESKRLMTLQITGRNFKLIITSDNIAFNYVMENRNGIFKDIPIVFCGVNDFNPKIIENEPLITGIAEVLSVKETLDSALSLQPKAKKIFVIGSSEASQQKILNAIKKVEKKYQWGLDFEYYTMTTANELKDVLSGLNRDDIVFLSGVLRDETGNPLNFTQRTKFVHANSPAPVYSFWHHDLGHGIVGGKLLSAELQGRLAGNMAKRILAGESPSNIPVVYDEANAYAFDSAILRQHGLDSSLLPQDSQLINAPESFFEKHQIVLIGLVIVVLQSIIIVALVLATQKGRRIARRLIESEGRLRMLSEASFSGVVVHDQGILLEANDQFYAMFGYQRGELQNEDVIQAVVAPESIDHLMEVLAEKTSSAYEIYGKRKDGALFPAEVKVRDTFYKDRKVRAAVISDITERKRAESELLQAHERLSFHIENSPLAVIEWKEGRYIQFWSKQAEIIFGWKAEDVLGMNWEDFGLVHSEDQKMVEQKIARLFDGREIFNTVKNRNYRKDGKVIHCQWYNSVLRDSDGTLLSLFSQVADVTELKEYEHELLRAKEAAVAASNAKNDFLANMSHEIRTPMSGILGMLQLLQTTAASSEQKEYVSTAIQASKRLTRLLSDILDLSAVEANRLFIQAAPLDLTEVVREVCELFSPKAQHSRIQLHCHVAPTIPRRMFGDAIRIQQILMNLLGNAFKFTREGSITLEAHPLPVAKHNTFRVLFSIADTGIGIPEDKIAKLFEPFSQVSEGYRREHQGAGLGLSICKRLVELMGGSIALESEIDVGTTFLFCINFELDETTMEDQEISLPQRRLRSSFKILLAEDDKLNRMATSTLLEKNGHFVESVKNGAEAVSKLQSDDFDIVLMDIQMPVLDGMAACRAIRNGVAGKKAKNVKVIAMTAYAMAGDREKFLSAGMDDYIAKPIDHEQLENMLTRVVEDSEET